MTTVAHKRKDMTGVALKKSDFALNITDVSLKRTGFGLQKTEVTNKRKMWP